MKIVEAPSHRLNANASYEESADKRIVVWLKGAKNGRIQEWSRIASVSGAEVNTEQAVSALPARIVHARQRVYASNFLGKFMGLWRTEPLGTVWRLPSGESAEQVGARETDAVLAWAETNTGQVEEDTVRSRWPECKAIERLGPNLFLVRGVTLISESSSGALLSQTADPRTAAEENLAHARAQGDRRKTALALTDLGTVLARGKDFARSLAVLEEAIAIQSELGDVVGQSDALGQLGLAMLETGQGHAARGALTKSLELARQSGDLFAQKLALDYLGLAELANGDQSQARRLWEEALTLARQLGDQQHEVDLLWYQTIDLAERGMQAEAISKGRAAIDLLERMGKPEARPLADSLRDYQQSLSHSSLPRMQERRDQVKSLSNLSAVKSQTHPGNSEPLDSSLASSAGLLRMAFTGAKSMARYVASGLKAVGEDVQRARLETCSSCEHHTGMRCRLCGCFTSAKTRLPHEACPIGKWLASR